MLPEPGRPVQASPRPSPPPEVNTVMIRGAGQTMAGGDKQVERSLHLRFARHRAREAPFLKNAG